MKKLTILLTTAAVLLSLPVVLTNSKSENLAAKSSPDSDNTAVKLCGDLNGDDYISSADLIALKNSIKTETTDELYGDADFNGDGLVNVSDVIILKRCLSQWEGYINIQNFKTNPVHGEENLLLMFDEEEYDYTGEEICPSIILRRQYLIGGELFERDIPENEYTIEYFNNIEAGTATAIVKYGIYETDFSFVIVNNGQEPELTDISELENLNINDYDSIKRFYPPVEDYDSVNFPAYEYTGDLIEPKLDVIFGYAYSADPNGSFTALEEYLDYTVEFYDNIDVGTATGVVTGIGNYLGEISFKFNIIEKEPVLDSLSAGLTKTQVETLLGSPVAEYNHPNGDILTYGTYSNFTLVQYNNGANFIYTNSNDVYVLGAVTSYTDSNDSQSIYASSTGSYVRTDNGTEAKIVFELSNAFRGLHSKTPFKWNDVLASASYAHAKDMNDRNFFDHTNLDGTTFSVRLTSAGYKWTACAENIAAGNSNAINTVNQWINSSGHRSNILGSYAELGVGNYYGTSSQWKYYWVQNFGTQPGN